MVAALYSLALSAAGSDDTLESRYAAAVEAEAIAEIDRLEKFISDHRDRARELRSADLSPADKRSKGKELIEQRDAAQARLRDLKAGDTSTVVPKLVVTVQNMEIGDLGALVPPSMPRQMPDGETMEYHGVFRMLQVVDSKNSIVEVYAPKATFRQVGGKTYPGPIKTESIGLVWLSEYDTSKFTDESPFEPDDTIFEMTGNRSYETTMGTRTVPLIRAVDVSDSSGADQ